MPTGAGNFFPRMPGIFGISLVWREAVRQSEMELWLTWLERKLERWEWCAVEVTVIQGRFSRAWQLKVIEIAPSSSPGLCRFSESAGW